MAFLQPLRARAGRKSTAGADHDIRHSLCTTLLPCQSNEIVLDDPLSETFRNHGPAIVQREALDQERSAQRFGSGLARLQFDIDTQRDRHGRQVLLRFSFSKKVIMDQDAKRRCGPLTSASRSSGLTTHPGRSARLAQHLVPDAQILCEGPALGDRVPGELS